MDYFPPVIFRFSLIFLYVFYANTFRAAEPVVIEYNSVNKSLGITASKTPLVHVLGELRRQTGWTIVTEPGLNPAVSIRVQPKPAQQTLRLLLGKLRYTLRRQPGRPFRLNVFQNNERAATEPIAEAPAKPSRIEGQIAVVVKDEATARKLAKQYGAELIAFIKGLNAARFKFKDEETLAHIRDSLAKAEGVEAIDSIYGYPLPAGPARVSTAATKIRIEPGNAPANGQLIIGLIDTAVQTQGLDKPGFILPALATGDPYTPGPGQPTHGTSMASIMLRGLSNADLEVQNSPVRILPVDVYGPKSLTTSFDVAHGITLAVEGGAKIINLSLGGTTPSALVQRVINAHHANGVLFVGAAGNEPVKANNYPAAYPQVMAVTATRRDGELATYANRGNFVDVAERGTHPVRYNNRVYAASGTSGATAYISGLAAALATQHGKKPFEIRELIIKNRPFVPPE